MYLFVFIFLLLSAMGLFTEVYMLQAARLWARQKTVGEIMLTWHSSAYELVKELAIDLGGVWPCRVSPTALPAGVLPCQRQLQSPDGAPVAPYTRHYLPPGYQYSVSQLRFPSVVYVSPAGVRYLVTYVPKEEDGETSWMGYTSGEILNQIQRTNAPKVSFGRVVNGNCNGVAGYWFMTTAYQDGTRICYPALGSIPAGSVGYVSTL